MTNASVYEIHPLAELFPEMQEESYLCLRNDIRIHGQFEPIRLYEGKVIDGRHRLRACIELGIAPKVKSEESNELIALVISLNLHRRHLTETQRGMIAAKLANMQRVDTLRQRRSASLQNEPISQAVAATLLNVSPRSVATAVKVRGAGTPELIRAVEAGRLSLSAAATLIELPADEQREIVTQDQKDILQEVRIIRALKKQKEHPEESSRPPLSMAGTRNKISEDAWHLWGRLHDLETSGYLARNPAWLLREMSDVMREDVFRAAPMLIPFIEQIVDFQKRENQSAAVGAVAAPAPTH
ncbi:MAG: ParB/RepB/Spo0J family partition protein [Pararobbsia sp.]